MAMSKRDCKMVRMPRKRRWEKESSGAAACSSSFLICSSNSRCRCSRDWREELVLPWAFRLSSDMDLTRLRELPELMRFMEFKDADRFMLGSREARSSIEGKSCWCIQWTCMIRPNSMASWAAASNINADTTSNPDNRITCAKVEARILRQTKH